MAILNEGTFSMLVRSELPLVMEEFLAEFIHAANGIRLRAQ
jgi:hypothetical protein